MLNKIEPDHFYKNIKIIFFMTIIANFQITANEQKKISSYKDSKYYNVEYKSKFVPPKGKVLFIAGQDKNTIKKTKTDWNVKPSGYAGYVAVSDLNAVWESVTVENDEANIQDIKWIADNFPYDILQIAIWMVGKAKGLGDYAKNLCNGEYDEGLKSFSKFVKYTNRPIFLRIGYEFDGLHNELEPAEFINSYRYIVDFLKKENVSNIAYVWHSYCNTPYQNYNVEDWYPGDEYVDWFGVTIFLDQIVDKNVRVYLDKFIDIAKQHNKPVMIAESSPTGGIVTVNNDTWNKWFVPYFNYITEKNIKAFSYINCNWDTYIQFKQLNWGNTTIQDFPVVLKHWEKELNKDKYIKSSSKVFDVLDFSKNN